MFLWHTWYNIAVVDYNKNKTTVQCYNIAKLSLSSTTKFSRSTQIYYNDFEDNNNMHDGEYGAESGTALIRLFGRRRLPKSFANNILGRQLFPFLHALICKSYANEKRRRKCEPTSFLSQSSISTLDWIIQLNRLFNYIS